MRGFSSNPGTQESREGTLTISTSHTGREAFNAQTSGKLEAYANHKDYVFSFSNTSHGGPWKASFHSASKAQDVSSREESQVRFQKHPEPTAKAGD